MGRRRKGKGKGTGRTCEWVGVLDGWVGGNGVLYVSILDWMGGEVVAVVGDS